MTNSIDSLFAEAVSVLCDGGHSGASVAWLEIVAVDADHHQN
jgi:hypothetical protein